MSLLYRALKQVRNDQIRVHYSGWSVKYDEWIDWHSNRVQKQCKLIKVARLNVLQRKIGKKGMHFHHNNRLDVLDETEKWLEARVIDVCIINSGRDSDVVG